MDEVYRATPRILNDQLMRNILSRQMGTARVRILTRLLERASEARLGYRDEELSSAEGSVYRTVLERTGLHIQQDGAARFAEPAELTDPGMRAAWTVLERCFTVPGVKPLSDVVAQLLRSGFRRASCPSW